MDYLGKGEMLTNRDAQMCVQNLREISFLCVLNISENITYFISALHVTFIFLFIVRRNIENSHADPPDPAHFSIIRPFTLYIQTHAADSFHAAHSCVGGI